MSVIALGIVTGSLSVAAWQGAPVRSAGAAEFDGWMTQLSNWGRWGSSDELGTVNLITPAVRKAAAALVTEGYSVSLARRLNDVTAVDNPSPFLDKVPAGPPDGQFNTDDFALPVHGFGFTHMDALSHVAYHGTMYNGVPAPSTVVDGHRRLSVEAFGNGIVSRGVLVDIPWLRGLPYLEPGTVIIPAELDAWQKKTGVTIRSGDVVFVRTGRWAVRDTRGPWDIGAKAAGVDASAAPWFKRRDIAIFGSDGAGDVIPTTVKGVDFPLHPLFLVAMGTPMLDQCDLEAVSKAARTRGRWTFLVTLAPLRASSATGSPVNIIATF
jgi:kynurenine formamidase